MQEGQLDAPSRVALIEDLRRRQLVPVEVVEQASVAAARDDRNRSPGNLRDGLVVWTRSVAALLRAGVPLETALEFAASEATHSTLKRTAVEVLTTVRNGSSLSAALRAHPRIFSPLAGAMVSAGEETGTLNEVLERLADHLEEAQRIRAEIRTALAYPALIAFVGSIGLLIILLFVVPRFVAILSDTGGTLPVSTRILLGLAKVARNWWWVWLALGIAAAFGIRQWIASSANRDKLHAMRLRLPLLGELERSLWTARFCRVLGLLLGNGVNLVPSLRIARSAVGNSSLAENLASAAEGVSQGRRLGAELRDTFPPLAVQLIDAGEESGSLAELALRVADHYDREVSRRMKLLVGFIEPAMILVFGLAVGFIALAMLQAIYSINIGLG